MISKPTFTALESGLMGLLTASATIAHDDNGDHELANLAHYAYGDKDPHALTKGWRVLNQLCRKGMVEKRAEGRYFATPAGIQAMNPTAKELEVIIAAA